MDSSILTSVYTPVLKMHYYFFQVSGETLGLTINIRNTLLRLPIKA